MKNKEKRGIIVLVIVALVIMFCVRACAISKTNKNENDRIMSNSDIENKEKYTIQLEDGTKLNNSKDLKDVKKYRTIEISNIQVTSTNGNTTILADAKNTGNETFEREIVTLILIDDEGMQVAEIPAVIPKIEAGKAGRINTNVSSADVANIKDFEIKER